MSDGTDFGVSGKIPRACQTKIIYLFHILPANHDCFLLLRNLQKKEVCRIQLDFAGRFKYIDGLFKLFSGIKFLTLMNDDFLKIARENQKKAFEIIQKLKIYPAWEKAGATVNLIGSLQTGLLMKHLDIDFHIYTPVLKLSDSFGAIEKIAENNGVEKIEYANLLSAPDACLEWHVFYKDDDRNIWQIDMMHIVKGSRYDGFFENIAARINQSATPEQKETILRLKYETPDNEKIMGIEYCRAVMRDGVRTYSELVKWRRENPVDGILEWLPE